MFQHDVKRRSKQENEGETLMSAMNRAKEPQLHIQQSHWLKTPTRENRGYIQPKLLKELWFHTGTICNLSCPFCLEGSKPGDNRLNQLALEDIKPFVQEALSLGVDKFSFTGGEPFVIKDMIHILDYCLDYKPCMVLTNGTKPLEMRLKDIAQLQEKPYPIQFRISFDYADPDRHDQARGAGNFYLALRTAKALHQQGFKVSIARQREKNEDIKQGDAKFFPFLKQIGLPKETTIVSFPDFLTPGSMAEVPHITESCMKDYHTEESRDQFMCNFSKMIVKKEGQMRVYACTLVDDDEDYDLGRSLIDSMKVRIMMKHHRCYSCFAQGASCSEGS